MTTTLKRRVTDGPETARGAGPMVVSHPGFTEAPATRDQREQRDRRRRGASVVFGRAFSLAAEIAEQLADLERDIAVLPQPLAMRDDVREIADAVHEVLSTVVGLVAESRQLDRGARQRTARAVADLAQRPKEPAITDGQIGQGRWAATLIEFVEPFSDDLSALLGRALPPESTALRGALSVSERLERALVVFDQAVADAQRHLVRVAEYQALPSPDEYNAQRRAAEAAERERMALGAMGARA